MSAEAVTAPGVVTVLVVDDSPVVRQLLTATFEADPAFEVVGVAANGREAVAQALRLRPSLITMDLEMPEMDGLAAIGEIMAQAPTPILVITSHPTYQGKDASHEARARGALETIAKPSAWPPCTAEGERLRSLARLLATVPVLPHVEDTRQKRRAARAAREAAAATLASVATWRARAAERRASPPAAISLVGIGASTGGPGVLQEMLEALPGDFPAPLVIVQHLSELHADEFVRWLGRGAQLRVVEALPGMRLEAGTAYVALRGAHIAVAAGGCAGGSAGWIEACDEPPRDGNCPAIDVLFESIARTCGPAAAGVLLTGMGKDGARGLLRLREAGGVTLVQDEVTSSIFGMPRIALGLGAAQRTVARQELAGVLLSLVKRRERAGA